MNGEFVALKKGFLTPSSNFNGKWYFYCLNNGSWGIYWLYAKPYKTFQLLWPPIFFDNVAFSANCVFALVFTEFYLWRSMK